MKIKEYSDKVVVPEGVQATIENRKIVVKGPKGEVDRVFDNPIIDISVAGQEVIIKTPVFTKKEKTVFGTYIAHIKNMFKGVTDGHEYTLKICSGHFPMNVDCKGQDFQVKNFLGEKVPRKLHIKEGAEVKIDGDKVTVGGIDKELVAQAAANIEQLTRRSKFDKRVFQDGIYIVNKDGKEIK